MKNDEAFQLACFIIINSTSVGLRQLHPDYLLEKFQMSQRVSGAYTMLNRLGQRRVLDWCEKWHVELPEWVQEYENQMKVTQLLVLNEDYEVNNDHKKNL